MAVEVQMRPLTAVKLIGIKNQRFRRSTASSGIIKIFRVELINVRKARNVFISTTFEKKMY